MVFEKEEFKRNLQEAFRKFHMGCIRDDTRRRMGMLRTGAPVEVLVDQAMHDVIQGMGALRLLQEITRGDGAEVAFEAIFESCVELTNSIHEEAKAKASGGVVSTIRFLLGMLRPEGAPRFSAGLLLWLMTPSPGSDSDLAVRQELSARKASIEAALDPSELLLVEDVKRCIQAVVEADLEQSMMTAKAVLGFLADAINPNYGALAMEVVMAMGQAASGSGSLVDDYQTLRHLRAMLDLIGVPTTVMEQLFPHIKQVSPGAAQSVDLEDALGIDMAEVIQHIRGGCFGR